MGGKDQEKIPATKKKIGKDQGKIPAMKILPKPRTATKRRKSGNGRCRQKTAVARPKMTVTTIARLREKRGKSPRRTKRQKKPRNQRRPKNRRKERIPLVKLR